jgi:hypothetical protein
MEEEKRNSPEEENKDKKHRNWDEKMTAEEIGQILDVVSTKVPRLLEGVHRTYYSVESGTNAGKSVGAFYKELMESGIPQDMALNLTERYMISVRDFKGMWNKKDE